MNKKNQLPIKWILGIILILLLFVYGMMQPTQSRNHGILALKSNVSSHNNFFQFLENIFGIGGPHPSSGQTATENNTPNQNNPFFELMGWISSLMQQTWTSIIGVNSSTLLGANAGQQNKDTGNTSWINSKNNNSNANAETNAVQETGNLSEKNSNADADQGMENHSGDNSNAASETNADQGTGNPSGNNSNAASQTNADQGTGNPSGDNSNAASQTNADQETGNPSGDNSNAAASENNADQGTGNPSGGDNSGNNSGNNLGGNTGNTNQPNLPVINPIPTDDAVSQSISQQNQQNSALGALLASRQALVTPVQQQAQASKYQTVNSQDIPGPNPIGFPSDIVEKVKSHQLTLH